MSETPETYEAVERWRQGKINIFAEMARLETERNAARRELQLLLESTKVETCSGPQPETDTPETDAFVEMGHGRAYSEFVDLCRRLEREREQFRKDYLDMKRERNSLIDQRDCAITIHESHLASSGIQASILAEKHNEMLCERNKWKLCADKLYAYICKHNFGIYNSQCEKDMCPLDLYEHINEWFEQINRETK
jgi:hypothetical protein